MTLSGGGYLNGERRPDGDTIVRWEQVCKATPGTLTALYDGSPTGDASPPPSRVRFALRSAAVAFAVLVALGAVLLSRGRDESNLRDAAQERPTGVAYHSFTASYVGDVWIRITPAPEHIGERHRLTLHWGSLKQEVDLKNLDRSQTLFTGKSNPDHETLRVNVKPAATIAFGERKVPAGAENINPGWKMTE